ncbi:atp-dependent (s)-nad(p)h-hydrate dehydratase [Lucifera butyrica]|uniref:Bifunctional NAD(P)H-hydrate repair enzyme n=1 Tax=Lucifera butyrica TaxID=1351585 RepID=A0A498R2X6_9FIRM|nr:NAD(P)H-hydrate dehydratase [Lucifera butyrica]VBB05814.1 atp-dependent (s)-nad(p)h-hydrate dehydratase [Lucifera butyrica]
MKVATAREMREIDRKTIEEYGIPGVVLMENAGMQVVNCIENILESLVEQKICIFAGTGNNGGDGYVAARHLYNRGANVKVFLIGEKEAVSGDARLHLDILSRMGINVQEVAGERDWNKVKIATAFAACLVDGLLGTGFRGEMTGAMATAAGIINGAGKTVVSIDIPSGVDADTGQVRSLAVCATYTVTFGLPKPGLFLYPGASHVGEMVIADIGIPKPLLNDTQLRQNAITAGGVKKLLPQRRPDAHKGMSGRVLLVAGSEGFTGAAFLAASGSLRGGAGLVTLAIAAGLHDIMEIKLTEVMTRPLPEADRGTMGREAVPSVGAWEFENDVLAIGPGLGRHTDTLQAVREIIGAAEKPLVIDADALTALAGQVELLTETKALSIITPHPGEMARLTGLTVEEINQDRIDIARRSSQKWESIVVLKGARTIVAFPDGEIYINPTGNAGMATGGTGDVLTGLIAALIAQGLSSHDAAIAGVYVHGMAGDIAARRMGLIGLTAADLLPAIPVAIDAIQNETK